MQSEIVHKHRFFLSINLTHIENLIHGLGDFKIKHPALQKQYINYLKEIKSQFSIISPNRLRRGLINGLGTVVKFITGNPDNTDLDIINNKIKINKRLGIKAISLALDSQIQIHQTSSDFNYNINEIRKSFYNFSETQTDIINYQILNNQLEIILEFIKKLVMTITLSRCNVTNIEMFNDFQIKSFKETLLNKYDYKQIIYSDKNIYKLLEYSELVLYIQHSEMNIILKVPILSKLEFKLYQIFPVPNENAILLLAPTSYYSNDKWYNHCWHVEDKRYVCQDSQSNQRCNPLQPTTCDYAKTQNKEYFYTSLKQTIISSKNPQTENCPSQKMCETYIMPIDCVQTQEFAFYPPTMEPIEAKYKLTLRNVTVPKGHHLEESKEDIPVHHYISWSSFVLLCSCILTIFLFCIYKRKRIQSLFLKPRPTSETIASFLRGEELRTLSQP